jgi:hypothetical protein
LTALALVWGLFAGSLHAAQLRFLDKAELSGVGLRLRIMSNARETPLPAPEAFTYVLTHGTRRDRVEMYRPYVLWIADQHAARWEDRFGNTLAIAIVRRPMPAGFPRKHVSPEAYKTRVEKMQIPEAWSSGDLSQWLSSMTGVKGVSASKVEKPPTRFLNLFRFSFPDEEKHIAYAFQLNPKALGQKNVAGEYFVASFELADGVDFKEADSVIRRKFLSYISAVPPGQQKSTVTSSRKFQARREKPGGPRSQAYQDSRDRVTKSIANMKDWWFAETEHYILISNASTKQRRTIKDIQVDLGRLRPAFEKLIPPVKPIEAVSVVRIFGEDDQYKEYVGSQYEWSSGLWSASRKELIIRPINEASGQVQHEMLLSATYHESFHQYLFYALDQAATSPWFNEGHACLFEASDIQKRGVTIRENTPRYRRVLEFIKNDDADLRKMMLLDYQDFYGNSDETRDRNYSLSWGLIYYLRKGVPLDRRSPYANLLDDYVKAVSGKRDPTAATRELFNSVDLKEFQLAFEMFWKSSNRRNAARRTRVLGR